MISLGVLAVVIFLFFANSLRVKHQITFTDQADLTEPTVTIADPSLGPKNAPVTLVNFGDYQCRSCADLEISLKAIHAEYPQEVRIVWKDMPNPTAHQEALNAALAARCAGEQKKFWEYHEMLMANQSTLGQELYTEIASTLDLRSGAFSRCFEQQETLPLVQRTFDEGSGLGLTATPTLYVNGERYTGAITTSDLRRLIDEQLSQL